MNMIGYASRNEIKELTIVNRTDSDAGLRRIYLR